MQRHPSGPRESGKPLLFAVVYVYPSYASHRIALRVVKVDLKLKSKKIKILNSLIILKIIFLKNWGKEEEENGDVVIVLCLFIFNNMAK